MADILLVENNAALGLLYRESLERYGHRVVVALSGDEAISDVTREPFDVAIIDEMILDHQPDHLLGILKLLRPNIKCVLNREGDEPRVAMKDHVMSTNGGLWDGLIIKNTYLFLM